MCCVTHLVLMCSNKTVSTPLVLRKKNGFGGLVFLFLLNRKINRTHEVWLSMKLKVLIVNRKDKSDTRSVAFNEVKSSDSESER